MNYDLAKPKSNSARLIFLLPEGEQDFRKHEGFLCQRVFPEHEFIFMYRKRRRWGEEEDHPLKSLDLKVYRTFTQFFEDVRNCHCTLRVRRRTKKLWGE